MNNYTVIYTIHFYDELSNETIKENGILYSSNYTKAMIYLEQHYGKTIEKVELKLYDTPILTFSDRLYPTIHAIISGQGEPDNEC